MKINVLLLKGLLPAMYLLLLLLSACSSDPEQIVPAVNLPQADENTQVVVGAWNPFSPGGSTSDNQVDFKINGNVSGVAWNQQRCYSYGDSLPAFTGGTKPIAGTSKGRLKWAEAYTGNLRFANDTSGNTYQTYYDQIDPDNGNAVTDQEGHTLQLYPSFATLNASNDPVLDPAYNPNKIGGVAKAGMAPADPAVTQVTSLGARYQLVAFCIPSCYRGTQALHFTSAPGAPVTSAVPMAIADAMKAFDTAKQGKAVPFNPQGVVTLAAGSVMGALKLTSSPITRFIADREVANPEAQRFYQFRFQSGNSLEVTDKHGLVLADGTLHTAEEISKLVEQQGAGKVALLTAKGTKDAIASVSAPLLKELSYNLLVGRPSGEDLMSHIVAATPGMYLAADAFLQNNLEQLATQLNRELDRDNVPTELVANIR